LQEQKIVDLKELSEFESAKVKQQKDLKVVEDSITILKRDFPIFIINQMAKQLEYYMNKFIEQTYNGRYQIKIKETKSGISITYGPEEEDVYFASGFEKGLFSIAYKDALCKISGIDILIMDEPDAFASEENSKQLFTFIGSLKDKYSQIITVTHKPTVVEMLQNEFGAKVFEVASGQVTQYE
jgi:DNA repair exonuclease SbcCD ATPase subunit